MPFNASQTLASHQTSAGVSALQSLGGEQTSGLAASAGMSIRQTLGGQQAHQVVQRPSNSAQVPSAASHQAITSTSAGVPALQHLGGQQTQQVVQGASASAIVSSLEESSDDDLLSWSELTQIFMKSCSRKNMAILMTRRLFSTEVRMSSNVSGRKKKKLDPRIIDFIRRKAFLFFPSAHLDDSKEWFECVIAIDESSRRLKNKPLKKGPQ